MFKFQIPNGFAVTFQCLTGMQATTSYNGACCVCEHKWTPGVTGTKCTFGGYRTLLPVGSLGRGSRVQAGGHTYEFAAEEVRPAAPLRSVTSARRHLSVVEALGEPCGGHKHAPLMSRYPGFDWGRMTPPELAHDSKIFLEMLLKCTVGKVTDGGYFSNWSKDPAHRRASEILKVFEPIWTTNGGGALPWRLDREARLLLDARMLSLIWPEKMEKMAYNGHSFWTKPDRIWKIIRKYRLLYFILPTQLRDQVPALRYALSTFAWGMRRLLGQVHSFRTAKTMGILPGSKTINKLHVPRQHLEVIRGLVLLGGAFPITHLNPGAHHFGHFGQYTGSHGLLSNLWMMGFERCVHV